MRGLGDFVARWTGHIAAAENHGFARNFGEHLRSDAPEFETGRGGVSVEGPKNRDGGLRLDHIRHAELLWDEGLAVRLHAGEQIKMGEVDASKILQAQGKRSSLGGERP